METRFCLLNHMRTTMMPYLLPGMVQILKPLVFLAWQNSVNFYELKKCFQWQKKLPISLLFDKVQKLLHLYYLHTHVEHNSHVKEMSKNLVLLILFIEGCDAFPISIVMELVPETLRAVFFMSTSISSRLSSESANALHRKFALHSYNSSAKHSSCGCLPTNRVRTEIGLKLTC